jgi:hypothetical protein
MDGSIDSNSPVESRQPGKPANGGKTGKKQNGKRAKRQKGKKAKVR